MNQERRIDRYEQIPLTEKEFEDIYGPNNFEWLNATPYKDEEEKIDSENNSMIDNILEMPSFSVGSKIPAEIGLYLIRKKRNSLIAESDYRVLPDYPISDDKKSEWSIYRQQLRDITDNINANELIIIEINGQIEAGGFIWPTRPLD